MPETKVHTLVSDLHNCGTDVSVHASEAELNVVLARIMQERIDACLAYYDGSVAEEAEALRALIAEGKIAEAWDAFNDSENPVKSSDDFYWTEAHDVEVNIVENAARVPQSGPLADAVRKFLRFGSDGGDTSWHSKQAQPLFYELMVALGDPPKKGCEHLTGYWIDERNQTFRCYGCQCQFQLNALAPRDRNIEQWRAGPDIEGDDEEEAEEEPVRCRHCGKDSGDGSGVCNACEQEATPI